jgi:hypothetical protein
MPLETGVTLRKTGAAWKGCANNGSEGAHVYNG